MRKVWTRAWWSTLRAVPGIVVIAVATFVCFVCHLSFPTVSFAYLVVVVLQSLTGDFFSSALVSMVAFLSLNYFFVPPIFSLAVSDPSDTLALISFLLTGLVVTRLTSQAQRAADSATAQRIETTQLYELARELLILSPDQTIGPEIITPFKTQFDLRAICLFDAINAKLYTEGDSSQQLAETTRSAYINAKNFQDSGTKVAVRLLKSGDVFTGAIGFEGLQNLELIAEPLAALASLIIERSRAFRHASHASAAAEAEAFRGVVLDALAHEFKTPLATILTAAEGLAVVGGLGPEQRELAEVVESEASRLEQLTSRLLRLARLDREEVKPQTELTDLVVVVRALIDQYAQRWPDRRLRLTMAPRTMVLADHELLRLGLGQILDNACKYSGAGSEIDVSIEPEGEGVAVRVWNNGMPIPMGERSRIFDRFYRGVDASRMAPGSGLGLYVARKIAFAHGGNLILEEQQEGQAGTVFRFTIPATEKELGNDTELECISRGR